MMSMDYTHQQWLNNKLESNIVLQSRYCNLSTLCCLSLCKETFHTSSMEHNYHMNMAWCLCLPDNSNHHNKVYTPLKLHIAQQGTSLQYRLCWWWRCMQLFQQRNPRMLQCKASTGCLK